MLRKFAVVLMVMMFAISCNTKQTENKPEESDNIQTIELAKFFDNSDLEVADKEVCVAGNVVHVCKHGGKRMFIIDDNPDNRLKITTGDEIPEFKVDMEGSKVKVTGIVEEERIDTKYLDEWEKEVMADASAENMKLHEGKEGHEAEHEDEQTNQENQLERIKELRTQLQESGRDHISFYSIKASKFEEVK